MDHNFFWYQIKVKFKLQFSDQVTWFRSRVVAKPIYRIFGISEQSHPLWSTQLQSDWPYESTVIEKNKELVCKEEAMDKLYLQIQ